jgi:YfiH family protein
MQGKTVLGFNKLVLFAEYDYTATTVAITTTCYGGATRATATHYLTTETKTSLRRDADSLAIAYQVHSARVHVAEQAFGDERPEGDGAATATPGVLCGALAADCAPVLMADPTARVVCAVHAGWRGALGGVIEAGVAVMTGLGASPGRIVAAVGPCIGPQSYEVGEDFRQTFLDADPGSASRFHATDSYSIAFDLPAYALDRLRWAGVEQAEWIGADTYSDPELFFSNRRALHRQEPDFGRLLSAIALV